MKINCPFDKIICLTLDKRVIADTITIDNELAQFGWEVGHFLVGDGNLLPKERYSHIDVDVLNGRRQAYNYYLSVQSIIRTAKQEKCSTLLLLEDDSITTPKFAGLCPIILQELSECNELWDLFFLGSNNKNGINIQIAPHLIKSTYTLDFHACVFNENIFDLILSLEPSAWATFDGKIANLQQKGIVSVLCAVPSIITQKPSFSFNENKWTNRAENHDL